MKKLLAMAMTAALTLSLAACGNTAEDTSDSTETSAVENVSQDTVESGTTASTAGDIDMSVLKGLTVGFSQCDNSSNWKIAETEDIQEKADEYGVNLIYTDASGNIAKQASDIEDMVSQGVDYLIVAPQEEDGLQSALTSAMDAGIGVILVDRTVNGTAGTTYTTEIMSDFVWEAQQVADYVIDKTGGEGNVVILEGAQGATSTIDRQKGFEEEIEGTNLKVIADQVANSSMPEAQEVMENILQAHGDEIDVVYSHGCDMALGALAAIKAAGYVPGKDILIATVDASKDTMQALIDGEFLCACSCSPFFGEVSLEKVAMLANGESVESSYTNTDVLYDASNANVDEGF